MAKSKKTGEILLNQFIHHCQDQGASPEKIRHALSAVGIEKEKIDHAFEELKSPTGHLKSEVSLAFEQAETIRTLLEQTQIATADVRLEPHPFQKRLKNGASRLPVRQARGFSYRRPVPIYPLAIVVLFVLGIAYSQLPFKSSPPTFVHSTEGLGPQRDSSTELTSNTRYLPNPRISGPQSVLTRSLYRTRTSAVNPPSRQASVQSLDSQDQKAKPKRPLKRRSSI